MDDNVIDKTDSDFDSGDPDLRGLAVVSIICLLLVVLLIWIPAIGVGLVFSLVALFYFVKVYRR